ncbi:hypothetical protein L933_06115 [Helicobacter pylori PZ5056]|uniref:Uncharacterized protein n=1 Tax=Helicobacter pylori PZ5056 TaxID=1337393 RepID=T2SWL4_HELPX|nr:hypothetical protein L933_06115 [Helicobacter pylori PZ5056]
MILNNRKAILIGPITTSIKVKAFALNTAFGVKTQRLVRIGIVDMTIKSLALKD